MWRNAAYNQEQQPASSQVQPAQELYHVDDVLAMIDNEQNYQVPHGPPPEYSQVGTNSVFSEIRIQQRPFIF